MAVGRPSVVLAFGVFGFGALGFRVFLVWGFWGFQALFLILGQACQACVSCVLVSAAMVCSEHGVPMFLQSPPLAAVLAGAG